MYSSKEVIKNQYKNSIYAFAAASQYLLILSYNLTQRNPALNCRALPDSGVYERMWKLDS